MTPLVTIYRGGIAESTHYGSIAIVDSRARLLAYVGDPSSQTFLRSAAKPFQGMSILVRGVAEEYGLSREEVALICGSHGGEDIHVSTAAAILRKGDFDESDLLCGIHQPFDEKVALELKQSGEQPSALHNNCSGKHGGLLLGAKLMDAAPADYRESTHPLQRIAKQTLADFAEVTDESIQTAIDGCGVPSFYMSLYRAAFAYAKLGATARNEEAPRGLPRYSSAAKTVVDAMTLCPEYVAGRWSITTPLVKAFNGSLLAKEGAEGFYAMLVLPPLTEDTIEVLGVEEDETIGIAIKISDGSMTRGRDPVILRTLELLGIESPDSLSEYRGSTMKNYAGTDVGEVRAEFDLELL